MKAFFITCLLLAVSHPACSQETAKWVFTNYPPANFQTSEGGFSGFLHDIVLAAFEERLGIGIDIAVLPWKRCQAMVEDGSADLMVTIPTRQRLIYAVTHDRPIWEKRRILYTYRNHPKMVDIHRLDGLAAIKTGGYTVISYLGNGWVKSEVEGLGIKVVYATTVEGMYRMLSAERGDLIIEEQSLATPLIANLALDETIVETDGIADVSGFNILISKKSPYAVMISRLNREIEVMRASGEIDRILARYVGNLD